ncbi:hypothetical protein NBRC116592_11120 [Colwellia sp. KU-HH00111]|uniref:DUF3630 family protein n=1 Tax=Colwellia sp. KU-HH00111 TaxID=3127652 RepID=UPI0031073EDD
MNTILIKSIAYRAEIIDILFNKSWYQEDINLLTKLLLNKVTASQIKETILGADRENIRFQYLDAEFVLNFDYYSQSCWICPNDEASQNKTHQLFERLKA